MYQTLGQAGRRGTEQKQTEHPVLVLVGRKHEANNHINQNMQQHMHSVGKEQSRAQESVEGQGRILKNRICE